MSSVVIRFFDPLEMFFTQGGEMPDCPTAAVPPCAVCEQRSLLPPAKMGWMSNGTRLRLFQICGECDANESEIKAKLLEKIALVAIAAE